MSLNILQQEGRTQKIFNRSFVLEFEGEKAIVKVTMKLHRIFLLLVKSLIQIAITIRK